MHWLITALILTTLTWTRPAETPSSIEQTAILDKARQIAQEYTEKLPDFLAIQTTRRQYLPRGSKTWKAQDTLVMEVAFVDGDERYTLITINGKAARKTRDEIDGLKSSGEFGSLLESLFSPKSAAKFTWERFSEVRGRPVHVFSYRVDKDTSSYSWRLADGKGKKYEGNLAYSGHVDVDRETHQVIGLSVRGEGIPADWPVTATTTELEYGLVKIDGNPFLVPLHAETHMTLKNAIQFRSLVEFSNYQKFSTEVTITPVEMPSSLKW